MSHKMNLGGTEKALLSFLNALEDKNIKVTLLLLEDGGVLYQEIPKWVNVAILKEFGSVKPIIFDPPLVLLKQMIQKKAWKKAFDTAIRYLKIKITKKWYVNYIDALKAVPNIYNADTAIAFAGPSDFISYYILEKVAAKQKIQWIHFDVSKVLLNKKFGNKFYSEFDKIFCVSENAKKIFDDYFPHLKTKSFVFNNILSKTELVKLADKGATFSDDFKGIRIVTLGRLSKEKGQDMIPEVVSCLLKDGFDFRWYVIGDGDLKSVLESQIELLKIGNKMVLLGSQLNPYAYLRDCDLYVQTSLHEGYCLTIHEAKMFDRAVVTTNVASAANLIKNNEDGLIVPISVNGLYAGIKQMLLDRELRDRCSKALLAEDTTSEIHKIFKK